MHRIQSNDGNNAPQNICRKFVEDPDYARATGGGIPYPLMIDEAGIIYQTQEIRDATPHAAKWNWQGLGIGVIGDFRKHPPTRAQAAVLVEICADLCLAFDLDPLGETEFQKTRKAGAGQFVRGMTTVPSLSGHDELKGGSSDPDKECPGKYLPMSELRHDVNDLISRRAWQHLLVDGLSVENLPSGSSS